MGQGNQKTQKQEELIHVAKLNSGLENKLSLTSNSLVSPADLEPESDIELDVGNPRTIDPVDPNAIVVNMDPSASDGGILSSKEISPQMTRRLLQNVAAIEKDLKLIPTVSQNIEKFHEENSKNGECEND